MNDMPETARFGIGGNNPPENFVDQIKERNKQLLDQVSELLDAAKQAPPAIDNDATHAKVIELSRKMKAVLAQLDSVRKVEVEPWNDKVKAVNGVFKTRMDPLKDAREKLDKAHEDYSLKIAAAKARQLEEEAEAKRRESERLQREAEEAERKQREAEARRLDEERKAREAEEARIKAIRDREEAERRAEEEKRRAAELAAQRKKDEEAEAERRRLAKEQQAKDEADAAARKEQERIDREAHEARMADLRKQEDAAREARRKADEDAAAAKAKADEERRKMREAEEAAAAAKREERSAGRDSRDAMNEAVRQDSMAEKLDAKAEGPAADLARSRSEHGAVGTLTRRWTCTVTDINALPMALLWPFVNGEAKEAAAYNWMMAQPKDKRSMPGTIMVEETIGVVR